MVRRFLEYSLRHRRPIRLVWSVGEEMKSANVTVVSLTDTDVFYTTAKRKNRPDVLSLRDVLSASYARGDSGSLDSTENPEGD